MCCGWYTEQIAAKPFPQQRVFRSRWACAVSERMSPFALFLHLNPCAYDRMLAPPNRMLYGPATALLESQSIIVIHSPLFSSTTAILDNLLLAVEICPTRMRNGLDGAV